MMWLTGNRDKTSTERLTLVPTVSLLQCLPTEGLAYLAKPNIGTWPSVHSSLTFKMQILYDKLSALA